MVINTLSASLLCESIRSGSATDESNPSRSTPPGFRLVGNLDFGVAARRRGWNSRSDAIGMLPNERPPGATRQNDESDRGVLQVLLVADAPVGREQQLEACLLGGVQAARRC